MSVLALHVHVEGENNMVYVDTLADASVAWQRYRDDNNIGASEMCGDCGEVLDDHGRIVGRIAYNGRIIAEVSP